MSTFTWESGRGNDLCPLHTLLRDYSPGSNTIIPRHSPMGKPIISSSSRGIVPRKCVSTSCVMVFFPSNYKATNCSFRLTIQHLVQSWHLWSAIDGATEVLTNISWDSFCLRNLLPWGSSLDQPAFLPHWPSGLPKDCALLPLFCYKQQSFEAHTQTLLKSPTGMQFRSRP